MKTHTHATFLAVTADYKVVGDTGVLCDPAVYEPVTIEGVTYPQVQISQMVSNDQVNYARCLVGFQGELTGPAPAWLDPAMAA